MTLMQNSSVIHETYAADAFQKPRVFEGKLICSLKGKDSKVIPSLFENTKSTAAVTKKKIKLSLSFL